ncbi:hypothetical protein [Sphingopyxis alaskensis]|uniref:Uncharacterized protein n=1 Tax=Sphingopyxis alaskensis (strain DSM 13593 / LMG 18877 / RB2256) TaxID=317655 RepID=Q1GR88_SPHAL|nr:hypothetical protein [Sphingopyxis alaskensis]ABF53834.1 conserved hypothetical protein [Sphingopyxis alaskensis RB2256]MCM3419515.1 hypothetical protein [Sphingopyxis alaskensis]
MADVAAHPGSPWLLVGGCLSIIAALAHLACIFGGPEWYRFFGAGEAMARAAGRGEWMPTLVTLGIAAMLLLWAAYALSGAGLLPRLPLLRTGLVVIVAIYLLRALAFVPLNLVTCHYSDGFAIVSSLIVLIYGAVYAVGTAKAWDHLAP